VAGIAGVGVTVGRDDVTDHARNLVTAVGH
jgi:hypothetical protein